MDNLIKEEIVRYWPLLALGISIAAFIDVKMGFAVLATTIIAAIVSFPSTAPPYIPPFEPGPVILHEHSNKNNQIKHPTYISTKQMQTGTWMSPANKKVYGPFPRLDKNVYGLRPQCLFNGRK